MKAILKVIWFALAILLLNKFAQDIIPTESVNNLSDNINAFIPGNFADINLRTIYDNNYEKLLFLVALFLGLDVISGNVKGLIKGPIKLALNTILYIIGFTIVFAIPGLDLSSIF